MNGLRICQGVRPNYRALPGIDQRVHSMAWDCGGGLKIWESMICHSYQNLGGLTFVFLQPLILFFFGDDTSVELEVKAPSGRSEDQQTSRKHLLLGFGP